jgi:glutathionylspermidine synthase
MNRLVIEPREGWEQIVESQGFVFHTMDEEPYWDETVCYTFTPGEIDAIERATAELDKMCLAAVQRVIDEELYERFQIPAGFAELIERSWSTQEQTVYGRFDLAYSGAGTPPKLLEYNADTPTSLLEAAVVQWQWFQDCFPEADQFNSIHERLIEAWRAVRATLPAPATPVYFTCLKGNVEDFMTTSYLRDTAMQAGIETRFIAIEDVGWNRVRKLFVDQSENPIVCAFKLYPWEWMARETFGPNIPGAPTRWLEAPWKMILSNKALLPLLYEMFPQSPYILPAWTEEPTRGSFVRKPIFSREGANIRVVSNNVVISETEGIYEGPYVYQQFQALPQFDGNFPVIGSWMVNGYPCGMGIREDVTPVTGNWSRFVPHVILND